MIVFITNYDDATKCNAEIYSEISPIGSVELLANNATTENLLIELRNEKRNIFAMSHGSNDYLCDQNNKTPIVETTLIGVVSDISIFAFACKTSNNLGSIISQRVNGCNWFGFTEAINAPELDDDLKNIYKQLFEFIASHFIVVVCEKTALEFLDELKKLCDLMTEKVDSMGNKNIATYQSIKQLWEKQQIWLKDSPDGIMHPSAPEPLLW